MRKFTVLYTYAEDFDRSIMAWTEIQAKTEREAEIIFRHHAYGDDGYVILPSEIEELTRIRERLPGRPHVRSAY